MEKINIEKIQIIYQRDDTETSLKILANKINEIMDVLNDCEPKTPAKWMPLLKEEYFYISDDGIVCPAFWMGLQISEFRLKTNNIFKTREEAEEAYKKIMSQ